MIGADVVGMSTVPEVIVAVHSGMRRFGLSVITDMCLPDSLKPANVEEIIAIANSAEPKLRALVLGILAHDDEREASQCCTLPNKSQRPPHAVRERWPATPRAGIILGSGLGRFADEIAIDATIDYADIPDFLKTHRDRAQGPTCLRPLEDVPVIAFQGRFHLYEGYSAEQAALPARLTKALGVERR